MKHLDLSFYWLRDKVQNNTLIPLYLQTEDMPADLLTKALPRPQVVKLRSMMGLVNGDQGVVFSVAKAWLSSAIALLWYLSQWFSSSLPSYVKLNGSGAALEWLQAAQLPLIEPKIAPAIQNHHPCCVSTLLSIPFVFLFSLGLQIQYWG